MREKGMSIPTTEGGSLYFAVRAGGVSTPQKLAVSSGIRVGGVHLFRGGVFFTFDFVLSTVSPTPSKPQPPIQPTIAPRRPRTVLGRRKRKGNKKGTKAERGDREGPGMHPLIRIAAWLTYCPPKHPSPAFFSYFAIAFTSLSLTLLSFIIPPLLGSLETHKIKGRIQGRGLHACWFLATFSLFRIPPVPLVRKKAPVPYHNC
ncbi:MAG: hypothetical protein JOS17DRAFT_14813 [Linnemannia elongata]|nr:MAG: hypothetical protein JOS17DRAFT_14813 [Linnemannia elongata]